VRYFYTTMAPALGLPSMDAASITPKTTKIGANAIQFDGGSQLQPSFEAVKNLLPSIPQGNNIILYTVNNDSTNGALRALEDAGRGDQAKLLIGAWAGTSPASRHCETIRAGSPKGHLRVMVGRVRRGDGAGPG
jgi:hypothetical protein